MAAKWRKQIGVRFTAFFIMTMGLVLIGCPGPGTEPPPETPPSTPASSEKAITSFDFASPAATGTINEINHTVTVTVPYGTNVTALAPTIAHTGASINPASGAAHDFTGPAAYTVTAADSSTQAYTVTVTVAPNTAKEITAFNFASPAATGSIYETDHTVAITVPYGTNVTALVPTITHTGASINPSSGVAHNFTGPAAYTVTAADSSTQTYTVTVTAALNPAKEITAFNFASPAATGSINETNHTVAVTVANETNVTALVPTISHTGASINPASGAANDFTGPVTYTVTAADSSTQSYTVTVSKLPAVTTTAIAGNLDFTIYIFGHNAIGGGNVTNQGSSAVTERGLCWNTAGSPTLADAHASDGSGTGVFSNVLLIMLSTNMNYHVRAYATNSQGTAYGAEILFNSGYSPGTDHAGGYVFYNDGNGFGLVAAKTDQSTSQAWITGGSTATTLNGNTGMLIGNGLSNTNAIVAQSGHTGSAAQVCLDYDDGTYSDWYLPSANELERMLRALYENGLGGFTDNARYWSSSEQLATDAYYLEFIKYYYLLGRLKSDLCYVRAIRAF